MSGVIVPLLSCKGADLHEPNEVLCSGLIVLSAFVISLLCKWVWGRNQYVGGLVIYTSID